MSRIHKDWLTAYMEYAKFSEAPPRMHFWCGVAAVAGALRRKVWLDMAYFKWHTNFYIILVAPPGIVSKSTTAGIAMNLLRQVPGVNFGPDVVTWQALVQSFVSESFQIGDEFYPMSALTIESSELGNLLNPSDRDMIDLLITLWDGKQGAFKKVTKMSGNDSIENPWINMVACTTPSWIAGNFPEYVIGGGFTSRCVFVYADAKSKYVAYPSLHVPSNLKEQESSLVHDLEHISVNMAGGYRLSLDAIKWGTIWYEEHYKNKPPQLDEARFGGYIARKQTHIHKLSMIIAASQRDDLVILEDDLSLANTMVTDLEKDMPYVFSKIGQSTESIQAERFIAHVQRSKGLTYEQAYQFIHAQFPNVTDFEGILNGAIRAGYIKLYPENDKIILRAKDV